MVLTQKVNLNGKYQFEEEPGRKMIRNWGRKYWELDIKGNKSTLEFDDD